jgi:glycosyltransferase involved in cell wall biosynthesis
LRDLVYLSPVRWADFAQRPHKFAEWHHGHHGGRVLWVEPYPSRLPRWADLRRRNHLPPGAAEPLPAWLELVRTRALPAEPLPGGTFVNRRLWQGVLRRIATFATPHATELVIGKPTQLALDVLRQARFARTVYDAMDDFPAFHGGLAGRAMATAEAAVARQVDVVYGSASRLRDKFAATGARTALVRNACDPAALPPGLSATREPGLVGYIGTIASWFDWDLVLALAAARPDLRLRLIGPLHLQPPVPLPANVELRGAASHPEAMRQMARFSVGLIPFRSTPLTAAVDPVKYYEYRALGIPVLSTAFGEMPQHAAEDPGVFLVDGAAGASEALARALEAQADPAWVQRFRGLNSWSARFSAAP